MITGADLAGLKIVRTIFHDVPNRPRNFEGKPTLADLETKIDARREYILRRRVTNVLASKQAYPMRFSTAPITEVPKEIRVFSSAVQPPEEFVQMSRRLATHLFAQHTGATSPGLLCVMSVTSAAKSGIAVLKLERQEGAEIKFSGEEGKRVFDIDVLENLILTENTRLFKSAMFLRNGPGDDDFDLGACDSQGQEEVARFWLSYLGCELAEEPRVITRRWYNASVGFANEHITDPVAINDFYEHLHSELKSNRKKVSPTAFIEEYLPKPLRVPYRQFMEKEKISLQAFTKDVVEIKTRLRRKSLHTKSGISVTVPEEEESRVKVEKEKIVVTDSLESVD
jgi:37-kD nucleoid-associated bacterial protein